MEDTEKKEEKKTSEESEDKDKKKEEKASNQPSDSESSSDHDDLEETISKAQDMGEKIGDIMEQKPVDPESALPPSTSVFLKDATGSEATHEPTSGGVDPELESKIVEKNVVVGHAGPEKDVDEPDDDLIEHQRDFERKSPPRKPTPPKESSQKPQAKDVPKPPAPRPPPRRRQIRRKEPVSNIPVEGKFQPAVAGVANTNLKKCPNCGGFVNLAVSKSCFNCGYDIK